MAMLEIKRVSRGDNIRLDVERRALEGREMVCGAALGHGGERWGKVGHQDMRYLSWRGIRKVSTVQYLARAKEQICRWQSVTTSTFL